MSAQTVWHKSTLVTVTATGEQGTILRKRRGENRYELEMNDGTFAYFYGSELRETKLDEIAATPIDPFASEIAAEAAQVIESAAREFAESATQTIEILAETVEAAPQSGDNFSLADLLWSDIDPRKLAARKAWELDRDLLMKELRDAERDAAALTRADSAYAMVRDRYFLSVASAHRNIARKAAALADHYATQPC
jgi:hypothetical protein